jgi:2-amino-4-hydroxy-6-hydroxymethyldihydropteridine diphosphokinase
MSDQHTVYLALGTNLGDRRENLEAALLQLPPKVVPTAVSRLYETTPAYVLDQPGFLNIAVKAQTMLLPAELLAYLKRLEEHIGRQKTVRYGPREIDIDIIFYDDLAIELPDLQIPHPRLAERSFVLRPLADIGAELTHPTLKRTVAELTASLPPDDGVLAVFDWQPHY